MDHKFTSISSDSTWKGSGEEAQKIIKNLILPSISSIWPNHSWDGASYENKSSIDQTTLGSVPIFESRHIDSVVKRAEHSLKGAGGWSRMPPLERKKRLLDFRDRILVHADELAVLDSVDMGKPYQIARAVDVQSAARSIEWYAELGDKFYGGLAPTTNLDIISYQPLGVVAAVIPWNYPLMIAAWKFAPILAAGNAVILKPAEQSPLSAMRLMEIALESSLPEGIFNVVTGDGETTGDALVQHRSIDGVGFTGSSETGKIVIARANQKRLKPVSLECGGKSPAILFDDCDVEKAVTQIAAGIFYNAGQSCNAPTRILAHNSILNSVIDLMKQEAQKYLPNNPLAGDVQVGAIVDRVQYEHIVDITEQTVTGGAELVCGGTKRLFPDTGGYYMEPTILTNVRADSVAFQEEIFGPVMPITSFSSDSEAVDLANQSRYGLWANVFTRSLDRSILCSRAINAGTVAFNVTFGGDITTPFGGFKDSGIGRDRSTHAMEKYMNIKHISLVGVG